MGGGGFHISALCYLCGFSARVCPFCRRAGAPGLLGGRSGSRRWSAGAGASRGPALICQHQASPESRSPSEICRNQTAETHPAKAARQCALLVFVLVSRDLINWRSGGGGGHFFGRASSEASDAQSEPHLNLLVNDIWTCKASGKRLRLPPGSRRGPGGVRRRSWEWDQQDLGARETTAPHFPHSSFLIFQKTKLVLKLQLELRVRAARSFNCWSVSNISGLFN